MTMVCQRPSDERQSKASQGEQRGTHIPSFRYWIDSVAQDFSQFENV
jgi:hypothetical protein